MLAYDARAQDDSADVVLFATCIDQAATLFCDVYLAKHGTMPPAFTIKRRTISAEVSKTALRQALRQERVGVASLVAGEWVIDPVTST